MCFEHIIFHFLCAKQKKHSQKDCELEYFFSYVESIFKILQSIEITCIFCQQKKMKFRYVIFILWVFTLFHHCDAHQKATKQDTSHKKKEIPSEYIKTKFWSFVTSTLQWITHRIFSVLIGYFFELIFFVFGMTIIVFVFFKILNCCCPTNASKRRQKKEN